MRFADLDACLFQGAIPQMIATCSATFEPNVTYLSQIQRVDDHQVALSCQFFNKSKLNVLENPKAALILYDPINFDCYRLELLYLRAEESGPIFDAMSTRIQAIASHSGMTGIFKLLSADIYEVLECRKLEGFMLPPPPAAVDDPLIERRSELRALQLISRCTCRATSQQELLIDVLATLDDAFGFSHSMVLVPDASGIKLTTIASHGYGTFEVGSEVGLGEGLIGTVAQEKRQLRLSQVDADLRYGRAVRQSAHKSVGRSALQSEVPLHGLFDAVSQMAIPLVLEGRLLGVIAVESPKPLAFDEWDEAFLEIVASQIATRLGTQWSASERPPGAQPGAAQAAPAKTFVTEAATPAEAAGRVTPTPSPAQPLQGVSNNETLRFRFFPDDDCVFIGDDYLVRNVPGRILWRLLRTFVDTGRTHFSNRELRLDPWLKLPPVRDNLESRLTLLRKRLEQKCPGIRLISTGRGSFRLETSRTLSLEAENQAPPAQLV